MCQRTHDDPDPFSQVRYRDFKTYYTHYLQTHLQREFSHLVSYNRFVELMPSVLVPLCVYLRHCYGHCTGVAFIDSTPLAVCHNRRIQQHRVFADTAQRGKNSADWFYSFKLHLVVNAAGELLDIYLTTANRHKLRALPKLVKRLFGKLFGNRAYLSQPLFKTLLEQGLQLITGIKANMKNRLMLMSDKPLLRKRSIK